MTANVECVADTRCVLGEGPVWDERENRLWFVDIKAPAVHRYDPRTGVVDAWPMPERVGALALRERGGLLVSLKTGFAFFDPESGDLQPIADPEPHLPSNRLNDGKCDVRGRFWAGTMDDEETNPTGHLYRLDPDLSVTDFRAGFVVTNGPAFSTDGRTLYFANSGGQQIWAYDFDMEAGRPGERRLFARLTEEDGYPDGMCVDAEDHLWSARWDGWGLARHRPDGSAEREVDIPAPRVTSCCFGGENLDELYVTTARIGLDEEALAQAPQSGGLFRVRGLGVRGLPMPRFAG